MLHWSWTVPERSAVPPWTDGFAKVKDHLFGSLPSGRMHGKDADTADTGIFKPVGTDFVWEIGYSKMCWFVIITFPIEISGIRRFQTHPTVVFCLDNLKL